VSSELAGTQIRFPVGIRVSLGQGSSSPGPDSKPRPPECKGCDIGPIVGGSGNNAR
jgi:hypothetical protein